jgi:hypothetical protein
VIRTSPAGAGLHLAVGEILAEFPVALLEGHRQ